MNNSLPVIQAIALSKRFTRNAPVISELNLTVNSGEVYALLGCNGVGKSTLFRLISGTLAPDSGSIRVFGLDPIRDGVAVRRRTAYVAELQKLYDDWTVRELTAFVKSFYPASWSDPLAEKLRQLFRLPADRKLSGFSRGMYAKAALLAAIARRPELLLLDDPMLGLDIAARQELTDALIRAMNECECTILLSTHIIPEVEGLADHVGILSGGRLVVESDLESLKAAFRRVPCPPDAPPPAGEIVRRTAGGSAAIVRFAPGAPIPAEAGPLTLEEIFLTCCGN